MMCLQRAAFVGVAALGVIATATAPADATVVVTITDLSDAVTATVTGDPINALGSLAIVTTNEGIGTLGVADPSFEMFSQDTTAGDIPAPGQVRVLDYNIFEPNSTILSDTLSITLSGHTPAFPGDDNVSVDIHFRSDSADEISPPPLADGVTDISETGNYQTVDSGLSDMTVRFASDVPEPTTLSLLGTSLLLMITAAYRRRQRG